MGRGTLGEVRDGLGDPRVVLGRFVGPSRWSGTGGGLSGSSGMGRGTIGEVRNGS